VTKQLVTVTKLVAKICTQIKEDNMINEKKPYNNEALKSNSDEKLTDPTSEKESYMEKMKEVYLPDEQKDSCPSEESIEKANGLTSSKSNPVQDAISRNKTN
jgi:hypothetical protein